jgi:hypothetical protein
MSYNTLFIYTSKINLLIIVITFSVFLVTDEHPQVFELLVSVFEPILDIK